MTVYSTDYIKRAQDHFIRSSISLAQLSRDSADLLGQHVSTETLKDWSEEMDWWGKRQRSRTACPHCDGDITEFVQRGELDIGFMFQYLITKLFDEIMNSNSMDPRKIGELRSLIKESGLKPTQPMDASAMTDLDKVLETING
jgi:hypothetical protein